MKVIDTRSLSSVLAIRSDEAWDSTAWTEVGRNMRGSKFCWFLYCSSLFDVHKIWVPANSLQPRFPLANSMPWKPFLVGTHRFSSSSFRIEFNPGPNRKLVILFCAPFFGIVHFYIILFIQNGKTHALWFVPKSKLWQIGICQNRRHWHYAVWNLVKIVELRASQSEMFVKHLISKNRCIINWALDQAYSD